MRLVMSNPKARQDYDILEKFEAGIVLSGTEVKAARLGRVSLKESYARVKKEELFLIGMHIGEYPPAGKRQHKPNRDRKLLLHRREIIRLQQKLSEKGLTLIPLSVYFNNKGKMKVELALCRGRKSYDKREVLKKVEARRQIERALKRRLKK
ncbi:MAG: SsrA-binding protein SmpB [Planctomycetota bacterium]|nr:SsrA-binding protein SmpB [Planctomycetota bacterium]